MVACKCGCGELVRRGRVFLNKEHQLDWMNQGGAREMNMMQPLKAKIRGGEVSGQRAVESGRLMDAAQKGGARSHEIAERFRAKATQQKESRS